LDKAKEEFDDTKGVIRIVNRRSTENTVANRKRTKEKKQYTKHSHKTKDRVTRSPLKTGEELRCYGRVSSSCSTIGTRRVNLVTNLVISHVRGKDREVFTTSGKYSWSFVIEIFHAGQPSHVGKCSK
jgi:hypothetical protein